MSATMRIPRPPHSWCLSPRRAIGVQRELAGRVVRVGDGRAFRQPRDIAGFRTFAVALLWPETMGFGLAGGGAGMICCQ